MEMNHADIIKMGYEAGLCDEYGVDDEQVYIANHLMQFAILVLSHSMPEKGQGGRDE